MGECSSEQVLSERMRIVMIGAGKLATSLGPALLEAGHEVMCVFSRTIESARTLGSRLDAQATDSTEELPTEADAYIVSVKDSALGELIPRITKGREQQLFVHTAGSMPLDVFKGYALHYGVLYPMQSFSKERRVSFGEIPVFIEASDETARRATAGLASSVSQHVVPLSTADRKYLHLAAVFACNFVNHCYTLSADILQQHGLDFSVMLPLTDETARKVHELEPLKAQTGPAVRYDQNVIDMQAALLAGQPALQDIYRQLSKSIHERQLNNDKL